MHTTRRVWDKFPSETQFKLKSHFQWKNISIKENILFQMHYFKVFCFNLNVKWDFTIRGVHACRYYSTYFVVNFSTVTGKQSAYPQIILMFPN